MKYLMKGALLQATMIASLAFFASCDNNQQAIDAKEAAEERNDERFDDNDKQADAQFLVNAAAMNHEEIKLGQLAQQKGTSPEVKELGKMMEESHSKSFEELKALAERKGVTIPNAATEETQEAYDDLNEKSGKDFDKAYADRMVDEHEEIIEDFEDAAEDSEDPEIKNWASSSLPGLRKHLEHSKNCQEKYASMYLRDKEEKN